MTRRTARNISFAFLLCLLALVGYAFWAAHQQDQAQQNQLSLRVIDVQHGDCMLLTEPGGQTMMIDTGQSFAKTAIAQTLEELHIDTIDILILTHPHNDHIGSASWLIENYTVGEVHQIPCGRDSDAYRTLQQTIADKQIKNVEIHAGDTFSFGQAACEYLGPIHPDPDDLNNASAILRMQYGERTFLFMGDAKSAAESDLMSSNLAALRADVLKVGHHARKSTSTVFLKAVQPSYAIVSLDKPSTYEDADEQAEVFDAIESCGAQLYRTDQDGTILLRTDGKTITVQTET